MIRHERPLISAQWPALHQVGCLASDHTSKSHADKSPRSVYCLPCLLAAIARQSSTSFSLQRHNPAQQSLSTSGMLKASSRLFPCAARSDSQLDNRTTLSLSRTGLPPFRSSCCRSSSSKSIMTGPACFFVFFFLPVAKDFFSERRRYISYPISSTPPSITQSFTTFARAAVVLQNRQTNQINCKPYLQFQFEQLDWSVLRKKETFN